MAIFDLIFVTIPFYIFSVVLAYFIIKLSKMIKHVDDKVSHRLDDFWYDVNRQVYDKVDEIIRSRGVEVTIPRYKIVNLETSVKTVALREVLKNVLHTIDYMARQYLRENKQVGSVYIGMDTIKYSEERVNSIIAILSIVYSKRQRNETFIVNIYKGDNKLTSYIKIAGDTEVPIYLYKEAVFYEPGDKVRIYPPPEKLIVVKADLP